MRKSYRMMQVGVSAIIAGIGLNGCRTSSWLNVPDPVGGVITGPSLNSPDGAKQAYLAALANFQNALIGNNSNLWLVDGLLSDELTGDSHASFVDARRTVWIPGAGGEDGDGVVSGLLQARSNLLVAEPFLASAELGSNRSLAGVAYALAGYAELLLAEDYCAGVTLDQAVAAGGVMFGTPLTTDSLLGTAVSHFNAALANAYQNDTVTTLASVGLGRALLDRGQFSQAATAVGQVPTSFVYNLVSADPSTWANSGNYAQPNIMNYMVYADQRNSAPCGNGFIVADREGTNGLNYVSAADARLLLDATLFPTCDAVNFGLHGTAAPIGLPDSIWYFPLKFGNPPGTGVNFPLATGVEARLIEAEAALHTSPAQWAGDLNALRAAAPETYLQMENPMSPLMADSTADASSAQQVDVMFRERAFWLFGTMTRLGDMRRLIRQYSRDASTVLPVGNFLPSQWAADIAAVYGYDVFPFATYGNDVSLTLPTPASGNISVNPNYKGCLSSTMTA